MGSKRSRKKKKSPPSKKTPSKKSRFPRQLAVTTGLFFLIWAYMSLPVNDLWFKSRISPYMKNMSKQLKDNDMERRMKARHGFNYVLPEYVFNQTTDNSSVLLPPKFHVKAQYSPKQFQWHHPIWHYYFFGPRNRTLFDPKREQELSGITHAIIAKEGQVRMVKVESPEVLEQVVQIYLADLPKEEK
ncbi:MAG: hypothetical protein ACRBF0_16300 [Calditrichia bacterium]